MNHVCAILLVLMKFVLGYSGETLMVMPPLEVRTLDRYPHTPQFQGRSTQGRPQILHTNVDNNADNRLTPSMQGNSLNNNLIETLNEVEQFHHKEMESHLQPASFFYGRESNESAYRSYPYARSYPRQSATSFVPTTAFQSPTATVPLPPAQPILPPNLSTLFQPVTNNVSGNPSGLLGLILSLLSGSSTGLNFTGLKAALVNGIIQPLLAAKRVIKSLIAKLVIPVIALILINIEVLVIVWWLWDDCPPQNSAVPSN